MRVLTAFLFLLSTPAMADQGVMFSFSLQEEQARDDITTSDFGFLVHFDKQASADLGGTAKLDLMARDEGGSVLVDLKLEDYVANGLHHIGTTSVSIPYGTSHTVKWNAPNYGVYRLTVNPKRHSFD